MTEVDREPPPGLPSRDEVGGNGYYSCVRECPQCGFRTWIRDRYWSHRCHDPKLTPPGETT